jgi:hypothetical protein
MQFSNVDRFLLIVIIILLGVIAIQNGRGTLPPAYAYQRVDETPSFPIKIENLEDISSGGVAGFPTDDQGRFVVVDGANHKILFCEVVWNGPSASLMIRDSKEF